jgi:hypothetical protein
MAVLKRARPNIFASQIKRIRKPSHKQTFNLADIEGLPPNVRFWTIADKGGFLARDGLSANDPSRKRAVHRSNRDNVDFCEVLGGAYARQL